ncbi:hypothetical protein AMATHDRAFT_58288 [Amanita thiersii Skay4041]|uniref:Uncharacterized protein n=1 Tax=Amanita thiersii Skay4041 TaxID=703135 RepID=A0A2A9NLD6_9AGAR|nr:hypothetical protein AMATHDRAFT_58288 [Amanita thiersii Skay4041]
MHETRAKITLMSAILFSSLTIWAVHYQQELQHQTMYQGVLRDDERRREKMRQREEDLQRSKQKRELYERVQRVQKPDSLNQ